MADPAAQGAPTSGARQAHGAPEPLARWEGLTPAELQRCWNLPGVHLFRSIGSTNDFARELGAAGAAAGTSVLAEEQTAGRGRAGRGWSSAPGLGLWFSIICRPGSEASMATLPIRTGLEIAAALDEWTDGIPVQLKWPNDLLLDGRKLGGILCEGSWNGGGLECIVVGVGLNLLHHTDDFPPELHGTATSLRASTHRSISRFEVASAVLKRLQPVLAATEGRADLLLEDVAARDSLRGSLVELTEPQSGRVILRGRAKGIAADGALLVWSEGRVVPVRSGTVRRVAG